MKVVVPMIWTVGSGRGGNNNNWRVVVVANDVVKSSKVR